MLVSVAEIFWEMIPDLPIPVRMTRPRHCCSRPTARSNCSLRRGMRARIAAASVSRTLRACERSPTALDLAALHDVVEGDEPVQERFKQVEPQRVLSVAPGPRRIIVDLQEYT